MWNDSGPNWNAVGETVDNEGKGKNSMQWKNHTQLQVYDLKGKSTYIMKQLYIHTVNLEGNVTSFIFYKKIRAL